MEKQSLFKKISSGKRKYFVIIGAVILILIAIFLLKNRKNEALNIITVTRSSVTQEVSVTGTVKPLDSVILAFEKSGKVAWVAKNVGDVVYNGEIIASLDNGAEEATLDNAKARYEELAKGSRPEDVQVSETALLGAKQTLANDYGGVTDTISDAYNKTDNAVNVETDSIFSNDQSQSPDITFNVNSSQTKNEAIALRTLMNGTLQSFKSLVDSGTQKEFTEEEADSALNNTKSYLLTAQNFMIKVSAVLNASTNLSDATLSTYKDSVATGRTNINTAIKAINDLIETIASQKIAVSKAELELNLKKLGETKEVLDQATANIKSAEATLRKTIIRSPINGVITNQDAKVGEIATANEPIVSVMSAKKFKIEAYVPEADLTKLSIGDSAEVTLDAYGNDVIFEAKVISINPAEKVIDGVSTYKTTFAFQNEIRPIQSGMTANVSVKTEEKQGVLVIPQRAVTSKNGGKFVNLIDANKETTEKEIKTGLKGSDGMIEIISGLDEGDKVVNYTK